MKREIVNWYVSPDQHCEIMNLSHRCTQFSEHGEYFDNEKWIEGLEEIVGKELVEKTKYKTGRLIVEYD